VLYQVPSPRGKSQWSPAAVRNILRAPYYVGVAYSGQTRTIPASKRWSPLHPVGRGVSRRGTLSEEWIPIAVPAIVSQDRFEAAHTRLAWNKQMARRNNTMHPYLLRGLVSCGQCRLACTERTIPGHQAYYMCRGRRETNRTALPERCRAPYTLAQALDAFVWDDLCRVLTEPVLIVHELERAHTGEGLLQALQARRRTLGKALAQLERQQTRFFGRLSRRDHWTRGVRAQTPGDGADASELTLPAAPA
jgi:site-specific DNA recombinase